VTLGPRSTLPDVAATVAGALRKAKIGAVLTGGGCATLYSGGLYQSHDLDYVLRSATTQERLDGALREIGFHRNGAQYTHARCPFWVEFVGGPLAIGNDHALTPREIRVNRRPVLALSATDSCRDRLAAWFHWNDVSSLAAAVAIATRHRVQMKRIERWSLAEGARERFEEFARRVAAARRRRRPHRASRPSRGFPL
jgi:hypothetical protein